MANYEIGRRIETRRNQLGLTLDNIASEIGVAKSTVQRYEKGTIDRIKLPVIEAIARVLDVDPAWLCGMTDTGAPPASDPVFLSSPDILALRQYCRVLQSPDRFSAILRFYSNNQPCREARIRQLPLKLIEREELFKILKLDPVVAIKLGQSHGTTLGEYDEIYDHIISSSSKKPTPVSESEPHVNIIKIAGRDGSFVEKRLTDKQLQALRSFVDLLPDASDDL